MKAVIFAAGLGTRLRPLTDTTPKPMIDVGGKPILERTLEALPAAISEIIIVVGHLSHAICTRFEGDARVRCIEQTELRGTHDALMTAYVKFPRPRKFDGAFLALNGDDLYAKADLERLAAATPFAMLTHDVPTPNAYSHLESADGFLKRIVLNRDSAELASRRIYTGACLLDMRFFDLDPAELPNGEHGLPQTLEKHLDKIPVQLIEAGFWMPVGTPEELAAARSHFDKRLLSE